MARDGGWRHDQHLDLARHDVGGRRPRPLVGHVHHVESRRLVQQHAAEMRHRTGAHRGVVQLAGIGLGVGDEALEIIDRHLLGDHDDMRRHRAHGDAHEIVGLPVEVLDQRRVGRMVGRILHQDRVAVGLGAGDDGGADIAVAAALVVDDHLHAQLLAQQVGIESCHQIGAAARRGRHHHGDRLVGIVRLGKGGRAGGEGGGRGGGGRQGDEVAAFHGKFFLQVSFSSGRASALRAMAKSLGVSASNQPRRGRQRVMTPI